MNRQFGSRAAVRADFVYRDYGNFYADYTSPGSVARDAEGRTYDLVTIGNDNDLAVRRYAGLSLQGTYRRGSFDVGGNYTLSRNWGNFEGETVANGPIRFDGHALSRIQAGGVELPDRRPVVRSAAPVAAVAELQPVVRSGPHAQPGRDHGERRAVRRRRP